jgi:hypothetical protein
MPEQAPDQPVNVEPEPACAVSVTVAPCANACVQVAPQSIPPGALVIEPLPPPAFVTVSVFCVSKIALTERGPAIVTVHNPAPEQAPVQPLKLEPAAAAALSVTSDP